MDRIREIRHLASRMTSPHNNIDAMLSALNNFFELLLRKQLRTPD